MGVEKMRLYRSLPYLDSKTILALKPKKIGINYEASNLRLGFCSPSAEYLRYSQNPRSHLNNFTITELAKYFYPSLFDALTWTYLGYLIHEANGLPINFLIWEVEIPDSLVTKYLGVGDYANQLRLEVKIPYAYLVSYLASNLDPSYRHAMAEFFTMYYSWKNADSKAITNLKQQLGQPTIQNPDLFLNSEDEIYRWLCFPITRPYQILINVEDGKWIRPFYNTIYEEYRAHRQPWSQQLNYTYKNWHRVGEGSLANYLFEKTVFLETENDELKRTLNKNGYKFQ